MRFLRELSGQSLVELSLALPTPTFGLMGGADLARADALKLTVPDGASAAAEVAAIDFAPNGALAISRTRDEMGRTPWMDGGAPNVTVKIKRADGTTNCVNPPTVAEPCFATVRVRYTFRTITPWPLVPNAALFDRQTTMRMIVGPPCDDADNDADDPYDC
ncbi:hypothetical protein BH18CHL2_BH18CHL2_06390 [soil metagenome]